MTKPGEADPRDRHRPPKWPATIPEGGPLPNIPEEDEFVEEQKPPASATESAAKRSCGHWCGGMGEKLKQQLYKVLPAITIDASQEYRNQDQFHVQGAFVFNNNSCSEDDSSTRRRADSSRYERPKCIALQNGDIPDPPIYELKKRMRSISGDKRKTSGEVRERQPEDEGSHVPAEDEPLMSSRD